MSRAPAVRRSDSTRRERQGGSDVRTIIPITPTCPGRRPSDAQTPPGGRDRAVITTANPALQVSLLLSGPAVSAPISRLTCLRTALLTRQCCWSFCLASSSRSRSCRRWVSSSSARIASTRCWRRRYSSGPERQTPARRCAGSCDSSIWWATEGTVSGAGDRAY